jgi:hypothetical protein
MVEVSPKKQKFHMSDHSIPCFKTLSIEKRHNLRAQIEVDGSWDHPSRKARVKQAFYNENHLKSAPQSLGRDLALSHLVLFAHVKGVLSDVHSGLEKLFSGLPFDPSARTTTE